MDHILDTDALKQRLIDTGYKGSLNNTDLSFLLQNKEAVACFMNISSDENYVSHDELELADSLKKDGEFIECEETLDKILLEEYSCDVNKELIQDFNIDSIKDELSKTNDNIVAAEKFLKLSVSLIEDAEIEQKQNSKRLKDVKSEMQSVILDCLKCDSEFSALLRGIENEYVSFRDMFKDNFINSKALNQFLVSLPSRMLNNGIEFAKKKVLLYVDICKNPSQSDLPKFVLELSRLKSSLNVSLFRKLCYEAEEKGLIHCLQYIEGVRASEQRSLTDILVLTPPEARTGHDEDEEHDNILDSLRLKCLEFAEDQVAQTQIDFYESKIARRNEKILALKKFVKIIQKYAAILDFLWLLFNSETELIEYYHSTVTSALSSLSSEFNEFLERKDYMENATRQTDSESSTEINLPSGCARDILQSHQLGVSSMNSEDAMKNDVSLAEAEVLKSCTNILENSIKRYKACETLKSNGLPDTTSNLNYNGNEIIPNIKSTIDQLNENITKQTVKIISEEIPLPT